MVIEVSPLRAGYTLVFLISAVACFGLIVRAREWLDDSETRWGLVTLLALSGAWAAFYAGQVAATLYPVKIALYILGLVVGFASVGSWLYFCSAYTGHSYHQKPVFRRLAVTIYASVIAIKITSPIHGLYFSALASSAPFPHLQISFGPAHWIVTLFAYGLSAAGFYLLFDLFRDSGFATRRLQLLAIAAGLPILFNVLSHASFEWLLPFNYEPVGVAVFAAGVLYFADTNFLAVKAFGRENVIDELDEAIILVDRDGVLRDVNAAAVDLFPELTGSVGVPITEVDSDVTSYLSGDEQELVLRADGGMKAHYVVSRFPLDVGHTTAGQALVFNDVTELHRKREVLEYHEAQLDDFTEAITHELRNTTNILHGHLTLADDRLPVDEDAPGRDSLATAGETADRIESLIDDLATVAKYGRPLEPESAVDLETIAEQAWTSAGGEACQLSVEAGYVQGEAVRLEHLMEKLFEFAVANGADQVSLVQTPTGFTVTDNGEPIPAAEAEAALAYGEAVPSAEMGMMLPVARTLAEAHGWFIDIDTTYDEGVRILVRT